MAGKSARRRKRSKKKSPKKMAPRQARRFPPDNTPPDSLGELLADRYHGAVNIHGIHYQLLYSISRCLQMVLSARNQARSASETPDARPSLPTVQFEGIEDIDVYGSPSLKALHRRETSGGLELVQAKTSATAWSWHKLGDPLVSFIEAIRTWDPELRLRLVVNFPLLRDLDQLAQYRNLTPSAQRQIRMKFISLCKKFGASEDEADGLLERMDLESLPEDELLLHLRRDLAEVTGATNEGVLTAYVCVLGGKALEWASARAAVNPADVLDVLQRSEEGFARQKQLDAFARGWIDRVTYEPDGYPEDFFSAKRSRIGHVVMGLDVPRPAWLRRIDEAFSATRTVVIRAPSGHGKSTLAFRYLVERWPAQDVILVSSASSESEVTAITDYLRHRHDMGLPSRVLIDATAQTRKWPGVAAAAVALGARVLVTVRSEDWHRYSLEALTNLEVLDPTLDREEARGIFGTFHSRGRVDSSVDSPEWAFERLQEPALLLEYVYLVTHGQMLRERLRDQIREFACLGEDPAKTQVLRLASLANALGAPILVERLLETVKLRDDPGEVIGSLEGEYLTVQDGRLEPLNWVRSEHVARILHEEGAPTPTMTALEAAGMIPEDSLPFFVANAMCWEGMDKTAFVAGLAQKIATADNTTLLAVLTGLFEGGEREFFEANHEVFRGAFEDLGDAGVFLIAMAHAPILKVNIIGELVEIVDDPGAGVNRLKSIAARIQLRDRGLDRIRDLLLPIVARPMLDRLAPGSVGSGQILDWCGLASVQIPNWEDLKSRLVGTVDFEQGPEVVAAFAQGLYRYDHDAFQSWFDSNQGDLVPWIQLETDCLTLRLTSPSSIARGVEGASQTSPQALKEAARARQDAASFGEPSADVEITFKASGHSHESLTAQAVRRLEFLRQTLPFCGRYSAQGKYPLPRVFHLPTVDAEKRIPRWNLPLPSDVQKNVVWRTIAETAFYPDTRYRLQERWFSFRHIALGMAGVLTKTLGKTLQGRSKEANHAFRGAAQELREFQKAALHVPKVHEPASERIIPRSSAPEDHLLECRRQTDRWVTSTQNYTRQLLEYLAHGNTDDGKLAVHNLRDATEALTGMHMFFDEFFRESPDYFGAQSLNAEERRVHDILSLLADGLVDPDTKGILRSPVKDLRRKATDRDAASLAAIGGAVASVPGVVMPREIIRRGGLRTTVFGVPVEDPFDHVDEVLRLYRALRPVAGLSDWIWLVPVAGGATIDDGGYQVGTRHLMEGDDLSEANLTQFVTLWLTFRRPVPPQVLSLLPAIPCRPLPDVPPLGLRILGLRLAVQLLGEQKREVDDIVGPDSHRFLLELQRRHEAILLSTRDEVIETLDGIRGELDAMECDSGSREARDKLRTYLRDVERFLQSMSDPSELLATWNEERVSYVASAVGRMG